jgi:hypothetical protein
MMINIKRGDEELKVSISAYNSIFKPMGFTPIKVVTKRPPEIVKPDGSAESEKTDDEKFIEDIVLKPISSWTKEELSRVVEIKKIDTSSATTVKQAREIVKQALDI